MNFMLLKNKSNTGHETIKKSEAFRYQTISWIINVDYYESLV